MTASLPPVGGDYNTWGPPLVAYLGASLNADGTLNTTAVETALGIGGLSSVNVVLAGSGAPSGSVGVNGDYYIDTSTGNLWGPMAGGSWSGTQTAQFNGRVLAASTFAPGSPVTYTVTGTSLAAFNATNLLVTFTAPESGSVLLRLSGVSSASAGNSFWGVSTLSAGTSVAAGTVLSALSGSTLTQIAEQVVTGLTAGTSYTWYWIGANSTGGDGAKLLCGGPATASATLNGPATMSVTGL